MAATMHDYAQYQDQGEEVEDEESLPNIEREELYTSIWDQLLNTDQSVPSIYEVPPKLCKENDSAYSPRVVSIGPIHKEKQLLKDMEKHKVSYMQSLFSRTSRLTSSDEKLSRHRSTPEEANLDRSNRRVYQIMQECVDSMVKVVARARPCYAGSLKPDEDGEFAQIMLFDGCFIIELVYRSQLRHKPVGDPILGNTLVLIDVRHDLLLLENQIPWFVLVELFNLTIGKIQDSRVFLSVTRFVLDFFGNIMNFRRPITKKVYPTAVDHILDLLHQCYQLPHTTEEERDLKAGKLKDDDQDVYHPNYIIRSTGLCAEGKVKILEDNQVNYSATALDSFGINFHASQGVVVDIDFSISCWFSLFCGARVTENPTCYVYIPTRSPLSCFLHWLSHRCGINRFEISPLCLYDSTESFLRNLMAYEQCKSGVKNHITSYVFLMNTIIASKEDVELLVKAKVLENNLGDSEDVLNLFNNMCKEVVLGEFYFSKPWKVVHEHCKRYKRGNLPSVLERNCALLMSNYLSSRWVAISVSAALILFVLQVLKIVYTIRSCK